MSELVAELVRSADTLGAAVQQWDALAVLNRRPMCSPAWMLAWWHQARPPGAALRVVVVRDGEEIVGLAPYFVGQGRPDYRLLGSGLSERIEPLARPGVERDVARAVMAQLCESQPRPALVTLEGAPVSSPWLTLLRETAPGRRPARYFSSRMPTPVVNRAGRTGQEWLATQSKNFRQQLGRWRRNLQRRGGRIRLSGPDREQIEGDVAALGRMHRARWASRGDPGVIGPEVEAMLCDAAVELGPDRFRLWMVDGDTAPVGAQVFVAAGGEVSYWNGGFDEEWGEVKPPMLAIHAAIEDAFDRGEERVDLGPGAHPYKLRFADGADDLAWAGLIVRNRRYLRTRVELIPDQLTWRARRTARRLPAGVQARLRPARRAAA